ncbi:MAG: hypothetical protein EXR69_13185 [Myxococcales bacterium]|nr:hypothetical protein [Myxococcales bacterium]
MTRVALVGAGDRLLAVELLLQAAGAEVCRAGRHCADDLAADLVIVDVPAADLRDALRTLRPGPRDQLVLTSRGLERATGQRLSWLVEQETACVRVGALAGPLLAGEIQRRVPSAVVVASPFGGVCRTAHQALRSPICQVYRSDDLIGTELAGAFVEVLCAALGAARGMGAGVGLQALTVSRGIAEGALLFTRAGAQARTFSGLAGVGELIAAASTADHPALQQGLALARGERAPALVDLCEALMQRAADLPITEAVRRVAAGEARAQDVLREMFEREPVDG